MEQQMKSSNRMHNAGSSRLSIFVAVLIIVLGALPLSGQAVQKTVSAPMDLNSDIEYNYERWWSDADEAALERGDYSSVLSRFDFIHTSFPRDGEAQKNHFNNFYLGNGQIGMMIDPFGAQALPYDAHGEKKDEELKKKFRSNCISPLLGTITSAEVKAEAWKFRRNTNPSIANIESWVTDEKLKGAEIHQVYTRGFFSSRASVFPVIDGNFDPSKIDGYEQRLELWNNLCRTTFVYDRRVRVVVTSFTSWHSNRIAVFHVELENISDGVVEVGVVAEPITVLDGERLGFKSKGNLLRLKVEKGALNQHGNREGLYHEHALTMGAMADGKRVNPENATFHSSKKLGSKEKTQFTSCFSITTDLDHERPVDESERQMSDAIQKGYGVLLAEHKEAVHAFWRTSFVLLPWEDLCKVYYRSSIIVAGNMRGSRYTPTVSMLTNPSYFGYGWGMDNQPAYDFLMKTGRADYVKNIFEYIGSTLPDTEFGAQLTYQFDINPWRPADVCNTSGNYPWMMYEYYRYTGDEEFLKNVAYPVFRSVSQFWSGYARTLGDRYGFWTDDKYGDLEGHAKQHGWHVHTYDESYVSQAPAYKKLGYSWAEIDHATDAVGPAKHMLATTIKVAEQLGVDKDLIPRWKTCNEKLTIAQNDEHYLLFWGRPDREGIHEDDPFPNRDMHGSAVFNLIYPTPLLTNDAKLENTYFAVRNDPACKYWWYFNYSQQLWTAVARMRMPDELEWLMTESEMKLDKALDEDGMIFPETTAPHSAAYFFMPYAMIPVSINEMLLQSFDGIIRTFPSLPPSLDKQTSQFNKLHAFDGFIVSAKRKERATQYIQIESNLGRECKLELPLEWKSVTVKEVGSGNRIPVKYFTQTVRINTKDTEVKVIVFETKTNETYQATGIF